MSKRFISIILLIAMLLVSFTATGAYAGGQNRNIEFKEWEEVHLVGSFKEWTITFNEEVDESSVINDNIYVLNHFGQREETEASIGEDRKTIIVKPPRNGYSSDYDYTLYIEDILSKSGKKLDESIIMKFFIDDGITIEEVEYQEDVVELEELVVFDDNGYYKELIMTLEEFEEKSLKEGSIIIFNPTLEDIYGYAGKIVSYRIEEDNVIIATEEPPLEELFTYIDIKGQQDISIEQMMDIQLREGIEAREYREYNTESQRYVEGVEYIFGSRGRNIADVGVEYGDFVIRGSIRVENPKIDFDIKTSFLGGLERFYLAYNADIVSDLEIEYKDSFSGDLDNNITLFRYPIPLGPTGLIADFKLDVYAEGNVNSSGKVQARVSQTTQITLGARKARNGNMEWVRNTTKDKPEFTSIVETEFIANAEAGISPAIELSFFKILSTELEGKIGPYVKLDARLDGGTNYIDGYFKGRLYTEVGVAFSSTIYIGDAFGIIDKTHSLGRAEIKIWSYIKEYSAETQGELQYIKFAIETMNMKVNEIKKLEVTGVYRNSLTGNIFESQIKDGLEYSIYPDGSTSIDSKGNIRVLNDENKEVTVTARYKGKEASMVIYVEEEGQEPVEPEDPIDFEKYKGMISAGYRHTSVLKKDGTVWSWGNNRYGQLGDGTVDDSNTSVQVNGMNDVVTVLSREYHTVVLKEDGTVWAWGAGGAGRLGNGTNKNSYTPVQVKGLSNVIFIASGDSHTIAVKEDGTVWGWGRNLSGEFGAEIDPGFYNIPLQINEINNVIDISIGSNHTVVLKEDGTVWSWGNNISGQLGDGTNNNSNILVEAKKLNNVKSISAGGSYTIALKEDGTVWAWGDNGYIGLGFGTDKDSNIPVQVEGISDVVDISSGADYIVALKKDGTVWAWGWNNFNQLGDGTNYNSSIPVQVKGLNNVVTISAGRKHVLALKEDGTLWAWGYNGEGQLGDGTTNDSNVPVKALIKLW